MGEAAPGPPEGASATWRTWCVQRSERYARAACRRSRIPVSELPKYARGGRCVSRARASGYARARAANEASTRITMPRMTPASGDRKLVPQLVPSGAAAGELIPSAGGDCDEESERDDPVAGLPHVPDAEQRGRIPPSRPVGRCGRDREHLGSGVRCRHAGSEARSRGCFGRQRYLRRRRWATWRSRARFDPIHAPSDARRRGSCTIPTDRPKPTIEGSQMILTTALGPSRGAP